MGLREGGSTGSETANSSFSWRREYWRCAAMAQSVGGPCPYRLRQIGRRLKAKAPNARGFSLKSFFLEAALPINNAAAVEVRLASEVRLSSERSTPIFGNMSSGALDPDPIRLNRIRVQILRFEHDLIRKPVSTFRDHALRQQPYG